MSDLIKRQDAIDAFRKATADGDKVDFCVSVINDLPSAEPEIIHCKDCKYREELFCYGRGYPIQLVPDNGFCDKGALIAVKEKIEEVPSAQTEVIRCKDCKYWEESFPFDLCMLTKNNIWRNDETDFCPWAERKEK